MRWLRALNSITIYCTLFFFLGLFIGIYHRQIKWWIRYRIGSIKIAKGGLPDIGDIEPLDCHYYEINEDDFIECPITRGDENAHVDSLCMRCIYYPDNS